MSVGPGGGGGFVGEEPLRAQSTGQSRGWILGTGGAEEAGAGLLQSAACRWGRVGVFLTKATNFSLLSRFMRKVQVPLQLSDNKLTE